MNEMNKKMKAHNWLMKVHHPHNARCFSWSKSDFIKCPNCDEFMFTRFDEDDRWRMHIKCTNCGNQESFRAPGYVASGII